MLGLGRSILFPRHLLRASTRGPDGVPGLERLSISIRGGDVEAFFLPGEAASADRPAPLVVFAHGNGELIDDWPVDLDAYRRRGISVLLPEFRGYGRSAGSPSERAIVSDFERFHDLALQRPDVDADRVIFHGRSIGGGVVCGLAKRRTPTALVLWSTFTSVAAVARRFGVPGFIVPDRFDNLELIRSIELPTLIVHGRHDRLIPVEHAHRMARAHPRATLLLYDADHNDCPPTAAGFWSDLDTWLQRYFGSRFAS